MYRTYVTLLHSTGIYDCTAVFTLVLPHDHGSQLPSKVSEAGNAALQPTSLSLKVPNKSLMHSQMFSMTQKCVSVLIKVLTMILRGRNFLSTSKPLTATSALLVGQQQ